ncbi:fumarylacetoacetase [Morchella snyderi]|nr:fumarylacetoacetase [Morchella snyderi]
MTSWLQIPMGSHFGLSNIPFGIITTPAYPSPHPAIAIGAHALDLHIFTLSGGFTALPEFTSSHVFTSHSTLNEFAALGRPAHRLVREYLQSVLAESTPHPEVLKDNAALQKSCLFPLGDVTMHLPLQIGDYTDFYAGRHHAFNVGTLFRGAANALQPNYEHMPIGYHGRASSVVVSGTPVVRPRGQVLEKPGGAPVVKPCGKLDFELELGAFLCRDSTMGESVEVGEAAEWLFGVVLLNDWSARDVQAWEYVPLGPFTSKSFATSISPWVVLMDALEPFRTAPLQRSDGATPLSQYLREVEENSVYDISLEVLLTTPKGSTYTISQTSSRNLLYSFPQMIAHHTITGCPLRTGDLLGTGTISGTERESLGSLLEASRNGAEAVVLGDGNDGEKVERCWLEDGDEVILKGVCGEGVGFGEVRGVVRPARS